MAAPITGVTKIVLAGKVGVPDRLAAVPEVFWLNVGQVNVPVLKLPLVGVPSTGVVRAILVAAVPAGRVVLAPITLLDEADKICPVVIVEGKVKADQVGIFAAPICKMVVAEPLVREERVFDALPYKVSPKVIAGIDAPAVVATVPEVGKVTFVAPVNVKNRLYGDVNPTRCHGLT